MLHGSMKTTLGQALGLSLAFSRTEMPGKGPQRGGSGFASLADPRRFLKEVWSGQKSCLS